MRGISKGTEVKAPVITLGNTQLRDYMSVLVRQAVAEILNALDAEAEELCKALKHGLKEERVSTRAGHFWKNSTTVPTRTGGNG